MHEANYTHTGFLPSGNSCAWYYDKNKHTSYASSYEVDRWSKEPKVGDKIKLLYKDSIIMEVFINGQQVYKYQSKDSEIVANEIQANINRLKLQKGFWP